MSDNLVSDRPPLNSLLRIFAMVFFGFVFLGPGIGLLFGSFLYEGNFLVSMQDPLNHPGIRYGVLVSQGVAAALGLVVVPWYYIKHFEQRQLTPFFRDETSWSLLGTLIFAGVIGLGLGISPVVEWNANIQFPNWMSGFGAWARNTEQLAADLIKTITSDLDAPAFLLTFIVVAILPAVGEELVFRGLIQTELLRAVKNPHVAIWITSVLFSAIHLQFMGFFPRMFIGAFLGYLYFWSGNLWIPMLAHFFNNGIQLIGLYLYQKGLISINVESSEAAPWPATLAGIVLTSLLMIYLKKYFSSRSNSSRGIA